MAIEVTKTLAKALCAALTDSRIGHGPHVYVADPTEATRPANRAEFTTVLVAMTNPQGHPSRQYKNDPQSDDVIETYSQLSEIMFSVQVFRGDAEDRARTAVLALRQSWAREMMRTRGLALSRFSDLRNITAAKDAVREPRYQFDVFYNVVNSLEDTILSIQSIDITGTAFDGVDETTINIEVRNQ